MYRYEFERITSGVSGWGLISGNRYWTEEDYRELIAAMVRDGWRYVGFIPAVQRGTGHVEEMDLVFEKEI